MAWRRPKPEYRDWWRYKPPLGAMCFYLIGYHWPKGFAPGCAPTPYTKPQPSRALPQRGIAHMVSATIKETGAKPATFPALDERIRAYTTSSAAPTQKPIVARRPFVPHQLVPFTPVSERQLHMQLGLEHARLLGTAGRALPLTICSTHPIIPDLYHIPVEADTLSPCSIVSKRIIALSILLKLSLASRGK